MKTAVLEALNALVVKDLPEPEIGPDEALLKVEAAAICGSDQRILRHGNPRVQTPAVIGHEGAGTVVRCGRDVTRVKEGDRVAIGADVPCGQCRWCRDGLGNNCSINYAVGYQIPGVFTQYMKLPRLLLEEGPVTPIGNGLTFEDAALAEPLACAINGLEMAGMALGKSVVIMGLGPIGCMLIDLARTMGARKVIAVQRSAKRMVLAQVYEADAYIASENEDVVARCRQETNGEGPDIVITACGSVDAHEKAIEMVAHRGTVNLFGGLGRDARPLSVLSNVIHYKECFVTGSHGCVPRHHERAVRLIEQGRVRVKPLITHRFGLDRINEAFETMASRQAMKVILQPHLWSARA